jgi:alpha-tubulin suppressor-like RCC1 family protein
VFGQLGNGEVGYRPTPVNVSGLASGVIATTANGSNTCALTSGGGVKCWGGNSEGQLGDGSTTDRVTPVDVIGLTSGVVAIATGYYHTCALMDAVHGGGVKCWGSNYYGQLGDGTTTDRTTPVNVSGLTSGVVAIAAGGGHTCALMDAVHGGGVKCWGDNRFGQLGDGTTVERHTPADVSELTSGAIVVAAGWCHTCAVTNGGGAKCWGANWNGQLGDGTVTRRFTPVNVSGLASGVVAVTAGGHHTCALTSGGGVKCWGTNTYGELGIGKIGYCAAQVRVVRWATSGTIPTSGSQLQGFETAFGFPAGTFIETVVATHTTLSESELPALPAGLVSVSAPYSLTATLQPVPGRTYTVTVAYIEMDRGPATESTLALYSWDGNQWVKEPTSVVSEAANTVTASPAHLSLWAVLGETRRVYLPLVMR